jgi:hypothetical protein
MSWSASGIYHNSATYINIIGPNNTY